MHPQSDLGIRAGQPDPRHQGVDGSAHPLGVDQYLFRGARIHGQGERTPMGGDQGPLGCTRVGHHVGQHAHRRLPGGPLRAF